MPIDIKTLAAQIAGLSGDDAASLFDAITSAQIRGALAREERTRAEVQRDSRALTCSCGHPVTKIRWLDCVEQRVHLGVCRRRPFDPLQGGYIGEPDSFDAGNRCPSVDPVFKTTWYKCDDTACTVWVEVSAATDRIVGWGDE